MRWQSNVKVTSERKLIEWNTCWLNMCFLAFHKLIFWDMTIPRGPKWNRLLSHFPGMESLLKSLGLGTLNAARANNFSLFASAPPVKLPTRCTQSETVSVIKQHLVFLQFQVPTISYKAEKTVMINYLSIVHHILHLFEWQTALALSETVSVNSTRPWSGSWIQTLGTSPARCPVTALPSSHLRAALCCLAT